MMHDTSNIRDTAKMALLLAVNCISAYIIIPLPFSMSPLSIQTMVINLLAFLLAPKQVALVMGGYLLMGLAGLPVFTGGTAGPGKLFGPTGGYIICFALAAVLISILRGKHNGFKICALLGVFVGIPVIYAGGALQLKLLTGMDWQQAFVTGVLPFIPMDVVKVVAAAYLTQSIKKVI